MLSDDELDGVAGGNRIETYQDGHELYKRGLLSEEDALHSSPVRDVLHKMGYKDNGGIINDNIYTDKKAIPFRVKLSGKTSTLKTAQKLFAKTYKPTR